MIFGIYASKQYRIYKVKLIFFFYFWLLNIHIDYSNSCNILRQTELASIRQLIADTITEKCWINGRSMGRNIILIVITLPIWYYFWRLILNDQICDISAIIAKLGKKFVAGVYLRLCYMQVLLCISSMVVDIETVLKSYIWSQNGRKIVEV